jgi:hypothetical protein
VGKRCPAIFHRCAAIFFCCAVIFFHSPGGEVWGGLGGRFLYVLGVPCSIRNIKTYNMFENRPPDPPRPPLFPVSSFVRMAYLYDYQLYLDRSSFLCSACLLILQSPHTCSFWCISGHKSPLFIAQRLVLLFLNSAECPPYVP